MGGGGTGAGVEGDDPEAGGQGEFDQVEILAECRNLRRDETQLPGCRRWHVEEVAKVVRGGRAGQPTELAGYRSRSEPATEGPLVPPPLGNQLA